MKKCIILILALLLISACTDIYDDDILPDETLASTEIPIWGSLPYLEVPFVSDEAFEILRHTYDQVDFFGEFSLGDPELYDFYRERFYQFLTNEIYDLDIIDIDMDNFEQNTFYFFDITGSGSPNLAIGEFMRGTIIEYIKETDSFYDLGGFHLSFGKISGTGRSMQRHLSGWRTTLAMYHFDNAVSVSFIYPIVIDNEKGWEDVFVATLLPMQLAQLSDEAARLVLNEAFVCEFGSYYFRVNDEQFDRLTEQFFAAWNLVDELIEDVSFTFEELNKYLTQNRPAS